LGQLTRLRHRPAFLSAGKNTKLPGIDDSAWRGFPREQSRESKNWRALLLQRREGRESKVPENSRRQRTAALQRRSNVSRAAPYASNLIGSIPRPIIQP